MKPDAIDLNQARRIAINAQGFEASAKGRNSSWKRLQLGLSKTQLLQIDSVNAVCRSHYLPLFSRTGLYQQAVLDKFTLEKSNRAVFEYWGHEASLMPLELHPLFRWRMTYAEQGKGLYKMLASFADENQAYLDEIYQRVKSAGPTTAGELEEERKAAGWWQWSKSKMALEFLFCTGRITTSHRHNFQRFYDITERVIPHDILNMKTPTPMDAHKALLLRAAEAHGVATEKDLRDYFRLGAKECKTAVQELVEDKALMPVDVQSWTHQAFIPQGLVPGKQIRSSAVLSPFDPLLWFRDRGERLFDFHYRLEIYTPAKKRKFGYYVLPVLHNEKIVGRIDVKASRKTETLLLHAVFAESEAQKQSLIKALLNQLPMLMTFLGLQTITINGSTPWNPLNDTEATIVDHLRTVIQVKNR